MIAVLSGLGKAVLPLMDFVGGQLYKYGGYYAVYSTSLAFTALGIIYIILIPESVTRRDANEAYAALSRHLYRLHLYLQKTGKHREKQYRKMAEIIGQFPLYSEISMNRGRLEQLFA